jgi:hypothetical protein
MSRRRIWGQILAIALLITQSPSSAAKPETIDVPGGIDAPKLDRLWETVKSKCLDLGYYVANEDRKINTIFCSRSSDIGEYSIHVSFFDTFLVVESDGPTSGIPLLGNSVNKRRNEMASAIRAALN